MLCGDLTEGSKLSEYEQAICLLNSINAPLKLVIAGNHDFSLDDAEYQAKLKEAHLIRPSQDAAVKEVYGDFGQAKGVFTAQCHAGIFWKKASIRLRFQTGLC